MKNEFGAEIGRNGYAPSIMQPARTCCCYLCGKPGRAFEMDRHEPFGAAYRQKSKELGLWVNLHHCGCHEGPGSVHGGNSAAARQLRADAQTAAMLRYGWSREKWIAEFGKSELSEEECRKLTVVGDVIRETAAVAPVTVDIAAPEGKTSPPTFPPVPSEQDAGSKPEGKRMKTVGDIIQEFWPEHQTTTGFRLIDGPDLPF